LDRTRGSQLVVLFESDAHCKSAISSSEESMGTSDLIACRACAVILFRLQAANCPDGLSG
jgi:hypothetical protein